MVNQTGYSVEYLKRMPIIEFINLFETVKKIKKTNERQI